MGKQYKIESKDIRQLTEIQGAAIATDEIMVNGAAIGFMYREAPDFDEDTGWRFFAGTETQSYIDNEENLDIFELNTVANYDEAVLPYLNMPVGSELERVEGKDNFELVNSQ